MIAVWIVAFYVDENRRIIIIIFYAILEFQRAPCQLPKMNFSVICIMFSSLILALFGSFSCLNASYAKKYQS